MTPQIALAVCLAVMVRAESMLGAGEPVDAAARAVGVLAIAVCALSLAMMAA